jgi:hypothetical protein
MSFFKSLNEMPISFRKHFLDMDRFKAMEFVSVSDTEFRYSFNFSKEISSATQQSLIAEYQRQGSPACTTAYTWMKAICEGPKVFKIDAKKWETLENYKLTVKSGEYHQPYPTVIFDFPDDYATNRVIPFDWIDYSKLSPVGQVILEISKEFSGLTQEQITEKLNTEDMKQLIYNRYLNKYPNANREDFIAERNLFLKVMDQPNTQKPDFVIMHHNKAENWVMFNIMMDSGVSIAYTMKLCPWKLLEDCWDKENNLIGLKTCQNLSQQETEISNRIIRACFNANLLLTHFGARKIGPASQSLYDQLNKYCGRKTKASEEVKEQNRIALRTLPMLYEFEQHIKLHTEEKVRIRLEPGVPTGKIIKPHWRSGHYRRQHYGVGNLLTKVIPIPTVFVNPEYFLGDKSDTEVEYR